jgi:hypothetical protein
MRRQPFAHGVWVDKGTKHALYRGAKYTVELDGLRHVYLQKKFVNSSQAGLKLVQSFVYRAQFGDVGPAVDQV